MPRRHPCPSCSREMLLEKVHEGFEVPCPACGHRFLVPPGTVDSPPPVPASAGAPPPYGAGARSLPPTRASSEDTQALVWGIIAFVVCQFLGPVAWYMGHKAREQARRAGEQPSGNATAGWILGIIATGYILLVGCFFLVWFGIVVASGGF